MSDTDKEKTILISGGGTGGHIYPAIAIAQEYLRRHPAGSVVYIGKTGGREEQVVAKTNFPIQFHGISAQGFPRKISPALFTAIYRTMVGFMQALRIVRKINPSVVIGTGGYVSASAVLSAQLNGIPTLIHEQNAFPGLTNRILGKRAKIIATSYKELEQFFPKSKIRITGNPVRREFLHLNREEGLKEFGFSSNVPTLLVFGGSQGAMAINQAVLGALDILNRKESKLQVILQTGEKGYDEIEPRMRNLQGIKAVVQPYLFKIQDAFAVSDLVISRSGAISLSEIAIAGLPSILIPYPYATANHQEKNARAFEKAGAAKVILEKELTPDKLAQEIQSILSNDKLRKDMSSQSKLMAKPDAAKDLCDLIESLMD